MAPPRLAPGTVFERRAAGSDEVRTMTPATPHRPVSQFHRAIWWRRHHLDRADAGEWRDDDAGWGPSRAVTRAAGGPRRIRGNTRAEQRADLRLAQHAQDLRAEAAGVGGREETRAFYGDQRYAAASTSEARIRSSHADTARASYEAEQAQRYEPRRRAAVRRVRTEAKGRR